MESLDTILCDLLGEREEILYDQRYEDYGHAAHCFLYAKSDLSVLSKHEVRADVLMLMRFDGKIGFPGGLIESCEHIVEGLNRELNEEINFDGNKFRIGTENHLISHVNHSQKFCSHFYYLNLSHDEYCEMEKRILDAKEYGNETLGFLRVPLYTYCSNRGFPSFLQHRFIANAKYQLLHALKYLEIMNVDEIITAVKLSQT